MTTPEAVFTRADWERLPEGFPAQLVAGRLVKQPSALDGHGVYATRILLALVRLVEPARVPGPPNDVAIDDVNVYQPDLAVYAEPVPLGERATRNPVVVFEIVSPSTRRLDRGIKRDRYLRAGVEEVWLVDPESRGIEVHSRAGVDAATEGDRVASSVVPGFGLVPSELFADPAAPSG